jgi:hypothetical protein
MPKSTKPEVGKTPPSEKQERVQKGTTVLKWWSNDLLDEILRSATDFVLSHGFSIAPERQPLNREHKGQKLSSAHL